MRERSVQVTGDQSAEAVWIISHVGKWSVRTHALLHFAGVTRGREAVHLYVTFPVSEVAAAPGSPAPWDVYRPVPRQNNDERPGGRALPHSAQPPDKGRVTDHEKTLKQVKACQEAASQKRHYTRYLRTHSLTSRIQWMKWMSHHSSHFYNPRSEMQHSSRNKWTIYRGCVLHSQVTFSCT